MRASIKDSQQSLERDERLDRLCDAFEAAWRSGLAPRLEDYLDTARRQGITESLSFRELLLVEMEQRRRAKGKLDVADLVMRFPGQRATIVATVDSGDSGQDPTGEWLAAAPETEQAQAAPGEDQWDQAGRFVIRRQIGHGGFGIVYLAHDTKLDRLVALKMPRRGQFPTQLAVRRFVAEARAAAQLRHPGLVAVYDVQHLIDGWPIIIQEYIEGPNLASWSGSQEASPRQIAQLLLEITEAVGHAHARGFTHRDLKPANILLDTQGFPHVADFGLSLHHEQIPCCHPQRVGSPGYMSPEQVRGEIHRLDQRADVWSLGVILFELLTGRRPFDHPDREQLYHLIEFADPPPLVWLGGDALPEMERICHRCLAKRATDRYSSTEELGRDLRSYLQQESPPTVHRQAVGSTWIIPKGLRSFDGGDADFFLSLLPGPYDRDGIPESVRFWRSAIERVDGELTFSLGLIYGPSGCGKSSLVKAGLLPRLKDHVTPVYLEATPENTEVQLRKRLGEQFGQLPQTLTLGEAVAWLRDHRQPGNNKTLIVLDQFEQWLSGAAHGSEPQLARALRHCDGRRVQCLVIVRDDFVTAAHRFFHSLKQKLVEGQNYALVDRFHRDHARQVLIATGRAFGRLPADQASLTRDQERFLQLALDQLEEDGQFVSVRLALFADMMKHAEWVPGSLKRVGGVSGLGVAFLDENFGPGGRLVSDARERPAVRAILASLLPSSGGEIRGGMRSYHALAQRCEGLSSADFALVVEKLDRDARLIAPSEVKPAQEAQRHYQLTHDSLVPSIREWLNRHRRETWRGRAELRLEERSQAWQHSQDPRHLPSWWEYLQLTCLAPRRRWTSAQRRMMDRAGHYYAVRVAVLIACTICCVWLGIQAVASVRTDSLLQTLGTAEIEEVPRIVEQLRPYQGRAAGELHRLAEDPEAGERVRSNAALALLPTDASYLPYLTERLLAAQQRQVPVLCEALAPFRATLIPKLWTALEGTHTRPDRMLPIASALALYDPGSRSWNRVAPRISLELASASPIEIGRWIELLRPARRVLIPELSAIHRNVERRYSDTQAEMATQILASLANDQPQTLADLLFDASSTQFDVLFTPLVAHRHAALALANVELDRELRFRWNDKPALPTSISVDPETRRLIEAAHGMLAGRFAFCQTMELRDFLRAVEALSTHGYRPLRLRPYCGDTSILVAAVWTRDARDWRVEVGRSAKEMAALDQKLQEQYYMPIDAAGYTCPTRDGADRYAAVWVKREGETAVAEMQLGVPVPDLYTKALQSQQVFLDQQGRLRCCAVSHSDSACIWYWTRMLPLYRRLVQYPDQIAWDIDLTPVPSAPPPLTQKKQQLADAERTLENDPNDLEAIYARAEATFHLRRDAAARADFDRLISSRHRLREAYQLRALLHARIGRHEDAARDAAEFRRRTTTGRSVAYVNALLAAYRDDVPRAAEILEDCGNTSRTDVAMLFDWLDAARGFAVLADLVVSESPADSQRYAERAVYWLRRATEKGLEVLYMEGEPDFQLIADYPVYQAFQELCGFEYRYATTWERTHEFEAVELFELSPAEHLAACQRLASEEYRPVAMTAGRIENSSSLVAASVWRRPLVADEAKEQLARRQANAAALLMRMGRPELVWSLLQHTPEPRLRSWLIQRLGPLGRDINAIVARLQTEEDVTIRRALLLSLGRFSKDLFDDSFRAQLLDWYRYDPDPGIHGACAWLGRHWDLGAELAEIDRELASDGPLGDRAWYVNHHGQTFAIIRGPVDFLMGAPATDRFRQWREPLHRKLIDRSFAISMYETTNEQFGRMHPVTPTEWQNVHSLYSPDPESPRVHLNWLETIRYCRWLSDREGIAEDQMCFPALDKLQFPLQLPKDYLQRTGYRLPTEAEWEFATRAGSTTIRHYGDSEDLLAAYAWTSSSARRRTWPVGQLLPNDFGLFDVHGNVAEWCQDGNREYVRGLVGKPSLDAPSFFSLSASFGHMIRGGSFESPFQDVRSAFRERPGTMTKWARLGFRLARTIHLDENRAD